MSDSRRDASKYRYLFNQSFINKTTVNVSNWLNLHIFCAILKIKKNSFPVHWGWKVENQFFMAKFKVCTKLNQSSQLISCQYNERCNPTVMYINLQFSILYAEMGKLLSKSNFRWFGPLNRSKWALKVIRCRLPLGNKRWKLSVGNKSNLKSYPLILLAIK